MRVDGLIFDEEGNVRQRRVVDEGSKVLNDGRGWDFEAQVVHGKVEADEIVEAVRPVVPTKAPECVAPHDGNVAEAGTGLVGPGGVDGPPLGDRDGSRIGRKLQFVQIVHGAPRRATKHVHAVAVDNADVRVAGDGWGPFAH